MILSILQARMSSSRLPGKVLKSILGKPMLAHQIERVNRSQLLDKLVIATSVETADDPIESLCKTLNQKFYRGSLDDVLDRYYRCAEKYKPDIVMRLTGDCPLADPAVIDATIRYFMGNHYDYVTNSGQESTFPDGLDVEVFTFEALKTAWENAELPSEREHVTPYIHQRPDMFKLGIYNATSDLSHLRWTVDEPRDFDFVTRVYRELYPNNPGFRTNDILELLQRKPEIGEINADIGGNEGLKKSLKMDKIFKK